MKLTTKGRYAVTAMFDLALQGQGQSVRLADIARRQDISLRYLEQLFLRLRQVGLVESQRGAKGGYRLARDPDEISVATIIRSIGEGMEFTRCGGQQNCQDHGRCLTHDLWSGLNRTIAEYLEGIRLGELCRQYHDSRRAANGTDGTVALRPARRRARDAEVEAAAADPALKSI